MSTKVGGMEKSITMRNPERAKGTAAAVIERTSTGKLSRNPRSPSFLMNDQNVSPSISKEVPEAKATMLRYSCLARSNWTRQEYLLFRGYKFLTNPDDNNATVRWQIPLTHPE